MKILRILCFITFTVGISLAASTTGRPGESTSKPHESTTVATTHAQTHTTTPHAEPTTPMPSPYPLPGPPETHTWNGTCLIVEGAFQFTVSYVAGSGTGKTVINLPKDASFNYECNTTLTHGQQMAHWEFKEQNVDLKFSMTFNKSGSDVFLAGTTFTYTLKAALFPGAKDENQTKTARNDSMNVFNAKGGGSWQCNANTTTKINGDVTFTTQSLHVQAFGDLSGGKFSGSVDKCAIDDISNIVPIAVGAALAGLVLIVLIAYLIGRRRSRHGYESV